MDVTVNQISRGIHAVNLISIGLDQTLDPNLDGLDAICDYLSEAGRTLREQLDACLKAV